jgi:hypothetical protein
MLILVFYQISMSREDEEHTVFIKVDGLFCYVSMPYGLKNAIPTFVHAMHKTFGDLIRDLAEVYVDDIIVKIKSRASLLDNLCLSLQQVALDAHKAEPGQVCLWGDSGQAAWFPGFILRDRG